TRSDRDWSSDVCSSDLTAAAADVASSRSAPKKTLQHFAGKAKHVIYLHMVGGPGQMDLFDYKPAMQDWYDKDLPDSIRMGQRLRSEERRVGKEGGSEGA